MTTSAPESVLDVISELLVERLEIPSDEVRANAPMRDLLTDSLMIVEMAIAVHDMLGITVEEEELRDATLEEFAASVEARRTDR
ncbi:acyl carrier protein [Streptomyces sp. NPDC048550]|uniref:acyl carrier protein n=1 Tax=unclassified Streptomyces TaxID=2593676 RepID=UPI000A644EC4|nr:MULTISPECIES: acyl carrier protein [unclassified Streptomyces]MCX5152232.1 acyl carrier protein [Streptomyces sp. NBC_00320]WSN46986.1 acyl carrier protein [Streptomyces sp. NBC_01296]WSW63764.1 acyl carrier protein [Streptomyces sp. NBC_00998]